MTDFKHFLKALAIVFASLLTIITSAGAIMAGGIYTFAGILNFGWLYIVVRWAVNYVKNSHHNK